MIENSQILRETDTKPLWKRILGSGWTKALLAALVLGALLVSRRINVDVLKDARDRWPWLVLAFVLMLPPYPIVSLRFWLVLKNQGIEVSFASALRWTMIGSFFDVVMPSSSGGDVIKAGYVIRTLSAGMRTRGLMAVVFDRALGLLGLFILAGLTSIVGWRLVLTMSGGRRLLEFLVVVCFGTLLGFRLIGSHWLLHNPRIRKFYQRAPLGRRLEGLLQCFNSVRKKPLDLLSVLLLSVVNHIFWCLSLLCITTAFSQAPPAILGFVVFPLAIFSNVFGFAGGFGVGTAAFDLIFSKLLNIQAGATIGITFQILSLGSRLTGLPWYLTSRHERK